VITSDENGHRETLYGRTRGEWAGRDMSIAGVDLSVSPASDEATPTGIQTSLLRSASVASPNILDQKKESAWAALVAKTLNDEKKKGMIQCVWYTSLVIKPTSFSSVIVPLFRTKLCEKKKRAFCSDASAHVSDAQNTHLLACFGFTRMGLIIMPTLTIARVNRNTGFLT